jgi:hypothetical protein
VDKIEVYSYAQFVEEIEGEEFNGRNQDGSEPSPTNEEIEKVKIQKMKRASRKSERVFQSHRAPPILHIS